MKAQPRIQKYMTTQPHSIGADQPMKKAIDMMKEHGFRHLPVQSAGKLIGVLTDRDIKLASTFEGAGEYKVEDVMIPDPYCVSPDANLLEVISLMAEKKYGCALVEQSGKLVGIFTLTDALIVLHKVLSENYKPLES